MTDLKFFIASSLSLEPERDAVKDAVKELNEKDFPLKFSYYGYNENSVQVYETVGAQNAINLTWVHKCAFFVLIFDKEVGPNSLEEFRTAIGLCEAKRFPLNIFVFYNRKCEEYAKKFINENASHACVQLDGSIVMKENVFGIPYSSPADIKDKIISNVVNWTRNSNVPLVEAIHTSNIRPQDFYSDKTRLDHCKPGIYFKRDFDDKLREYATSCVGNAVYVTGASLSGKTRSVFKLLRDIDNSWYIYMNNDKSLEEKSEFVRSLAYYLKFSSFSQKLYVVFDDFDKYELENESLKTAFDGFFKVLHGSNCTVIVISSVSVDELKFSWAELENQTVQIKDMSDEECQDAELFFRRNGLIGNETENAAQNNVQYRMTGAMLVNLLQKRTEYSNFINRQNSEIYKEYVVNLYRTLKAMSIWYAEEKGDFNLIYDFWKYLCERRECKPLGIFEFKDLLVNIEKSLIGIKIIRNNNKDIVSLDVQEYVYRYFLNHDGSVVSDSSVPCAEKEKELIEIIMAYVGEKFKSEMLVHYSRIMNRCDFRKELVPYLFDIFNATNYAENTTEWKKLLVEDRKKYESEHANEKSGFYYSRIYKQKIYSLGSFEEALSVYDKVECSKRDEFLYASLISSARTGKDFEKVWNHDDYERFKDNFFIICRLAEVKCKEGNGQRSSFMKFDRIYELITEALKNETFKNESFLLENLVNDRLQKEVMHVLDYVRKSFSLLFSLVTSKEEMDKFIALARQWYFLLCNNEDKIKEYLDSNGKSYMKDSLTELELLQTVNTFHLRSGHMGVYGDMSVSEVGKHMKDHYINVIPVAYEHGSPKFRIRQTICTIANAALSVYKPSDKKSEGVRQKEYDDIKRNIFSILEYPDKNLVLRDSYVYGSMLDLCPDVYAALDVFYDYMRPHLDDSSNPFMLNCLLLNRLLNKAYKTKDKILDVKEIADSYDMEKDRYYYDSIIRSMSYYDSLSILADRVTKEKLPFTKYTVPNLLETIDSIPLALTLFSDIPEMKGLTFHKRFDGIKVLCDELSSLPGEFRPENQHFSWMLLFKKKCTTLQERDALLKCLEYLEEKKPEMFLTDNEHDNRLYNRILSNKTIIPDFSKAKSFVYEHSRTFVPDAYTISHLLDFLDEMAEDKKSDALKEVFQICVDREFNPTSKNASKRLSFYNSQKDLQPAYIIENDGSLNEKKMLPVQYLCRLSDLGYEITSYHINSLMHIENYMTTDVIDKVIGLATRHDIEILPELYSYIRRKYNNVVTDDQLTRLKERMSEATTDRYNIKLVNAVDNGIEDAETALKKVDTSSVFSATKAYNAILSKLPKQYSFKEVHVLCFDCFKDKIIPTEQTYGILSQYARRINDIGLILNDISVHKDRFRTDVRVSSYICVSHIKLAGSVSELKEVVMLYTKDADYIFNDIVYDHILLKLVYLANEGADKERASGVLKHVMQLMGIYECQPSQELKALTEDLKLDVYENGANVSSRTISNIFHYNDFGSEGEIRDIVGKVLGKYPDLFNEDVLKRLIFYCNGKTCRFKEILDLFYISEKLESEFIRLKLILIHKKSHKFDLDEYRSYLDIIRESSMNPDYKRVLLIWMLRIAYKYQHHRSYSSVSKRVLTKIYNGDPVSINDFKSSRKDDEIEYMIHPQELADIDFYPLLKDKVDSAEVAEEKLMCISDHVRNFPQRKNEKAIAKLCAEIKDDVFLKQIADAVSYNSRLLNIVQNRMAEIFWNYQGLCDLMSLCLKHNLKTDPKLYSNMILTICYRVYYDDRLTSVYEQIVSRLSSEEGTLSARDFLIGKESEDTFLNFDVRLIYSVRERMMLAMAISRAAGLSEISDIISDYCLDKEITDLFIEDKGLILNAVLAKCISLCKDASSTDPDHCSGLSENLKKIFFRKGNEVNVGILFGNGLNRCGLNLTVPKKLLNYALLTQMDLEDEEMIDCAIKNNIFRSWINCVPTVKKAGDFITVIREKYADKIADYVPSTIKAILKKIYSESAIKEALCLVNTNLISLKDKSCIHALIMAIIRILKTDINLLCKLKYINLRDDLYLQDLGNIFEIHGLAKFKIKLTAKDRSDVMELYDTAYLDAMNLLYHKSVLAPDYVMPQPVSVAMKSFEKNFIRKLSMEGKDSHVTFWTLQKVAYHWDKCTFYRPSSNMAVAFLRRYMDYLDSDGKENEMAERIRNNVMKALDYTKRNKYPNVNLYYTTMSSRVKRTSSKFVECSVEDIDKLMKEVDNNNFC